MCTLISKNGGNERKKASLLSTGSSRTAIWTDYDYIPTTNIVTVREGKQVYNCPVILTYYKSFKENEKQEDPAQFLPHLHL